MAPEASETKKPFEFSLWLLKATHPVSWNDSKASNYFDSAYDRTDRVGNGALFETDIPTPLTLGFIRKLAITKLQTTDVLTFPCIYVFQIRLHLVFFLTVQTSPCFGRKIPL